MELTAGNSGALGIFPRQEEGAPIRRVHNYAVWFLARSEQFNKSFVRVHSILLV